MRTGYTYDDEMPQSRGSFHNPNSSRRNKPFTGKKIGNIGINKETGDIEIIPLREEEQAKEENNKQQ